jgi:hypothetical protein
MTAGEQYTSPWLVTNEKGGHAFTHGLSGRPQIVKVFGRESVTGPEFELNSKSMILQIDEHSILLDKKVAMHCQEVRVTAEWSKDDLDISPFADRTKQELNLQTPWLKEVDAL